MALTIDDVRAEIDLDEINYPATAERLGPEALPLLQELADGSDPTLASKAVYLAGVISPDDAAPIVNQAAGHPDPVVRIAAAAGLSNLAEGDAENPLDRLLEDDDVGVRKAALKSAAAFETQPMNARVQQVAEQDPEPLMRQLAEQSVPESSP